MGPGGFRPGGPPRSDAPAPARFGPPKKKSAQSEKRWEDKERGPKGPIKERYTGRMDGLYDDPNEVIEPMPDFDDPASKAPDDDKITGDEPMKTHVKVVAALLIVFGVLGLFGALFSSVIFGALATFVGTSHEEGAGVGMAVLGLTGIALTIVPVRRLDTLRRLRLGPAWLPPWSRILGIILSAISLVRFPFGTIFGIYGLMILFNKETEALFRAALRPFEPRDPRPGAGAPAQRAGRRKAERVKSWPLERRPRCGRRRWTCPRRRARRR